VHRSCHQGNLICNNTLKGIIQRLGAIYLTKQDGTDLLIDDKERTPLSDVIYGAKAGIDIQRKPMITLEIKDANK
jgi:SecD/SecF fusion protein